MKVTSKKIIKKTKSNTVLFNIKIDKKQKERAQKVAKDIGLPLGTVVNLLIDKFIDEKRVVAQESYIPNARLRKSIEEARKEYASGKMKSFTDMDEMFAYLNS